MFPVFPGRPNVSSGVGGIKSAPAYLVVSRIKLIPLLVFWSLAQKYHISLGDFGTRHNLMRQSDLEGFEVGGGLFPLCVSMKRN